MNSVQLIGRLTHEPDPRHTPSGTPVTTFRLAIDRAGRDGADFVTVKTWERLAEASAEHLTRGRRVAVQGRLAHEEWTGSDGRRAERLTVVAGRVEFLDAPTVSTDAAAADNEAADEPPTVPPAGSQSSARSGRGGPPRAA